MFFSRFYRRARQVVVESLTFRSFTLPLELSSAHHIRDSLAHIAERWPEIAKDSSDEQPIFVFSAGWRSGSTLVQRLVCSSNSVLLWGEPLGDSAVIPRMAAQLSVITKDWPPDSFFSPYRMDMEALSRKWIANLSPSIQSFHKAHRSFFTEWVAKPAIEHQAERWGLKEVRLTIEHAMYLHWLYPNAKFIFVYRNPYDAYISWRGNTWASKWPKYFSWSPIVYARHWKLLLEGYLDGCNSVGGYIIKFEDLVAGKEDLDSLSSYLGLANIDTTVLANRIASPDKVRKKKVRWLSPVEWVLIRIIAGKVMKRVGYL